MGSLILQTITRSLLCLMLLFSWWVLFRGHNSPGGGFIAGLIVACAFALYLVAYGVEATRRRIYFSIPAWLFTGIIFVSGSGLLPMLIHKPYLTSLWSSRLDFLLNTPLLFDVGVYLVVWASILSMLFVLERDVC